MWPTSLGSSAKPVGGRLSLVALGCAFAILLIYALYTSIIVPVLHLDGAYQTANGLNRYAGGQLPGRDFLPYLGIGPYLVLYPLYWAAGSTVAAATFAAQFVTVLAGWFVSTLACRFLLPIRSSRTAALVGGLLFASFCLLGFATDGLLGRYGAIFSGLSFYTHPGNSLRPIRALIPYLIAAVLVLLLRRMSPGPRRDAIAGASLGVTALWSNDFAVPTLGAFGLFYVCALRWRDFRVSIFSSVIFSVTCALSAIVVLLLATGGGAKDFLEYNFHGVAKDQWWYFGDHGASHRVFGPKDIWLIFLNTGIVPLFVLAGLFYLVLKHKRLEWGAVATIGLTLLGGGSISSAGGMVQWSYFGAFHYWCAVVLVILVWLKLVPVGWQQKVLAGLEKRKMTASVTLVVIGFAAALGMGGAYLSKLHRISESKAFIYVSELGGYLPAAFSKYVALARERPGESVVEEYWGIWSAVNRSSTPWRVDSVIHALGAWRTEAHNRLPAAERVVTTAPTLSSYQAWSFSANFWLYEQLLREWEPVASSPSTVVWELRGQRRQWPSVMCVVTGPQTFVVGEGEVGLYRVSLDYQVRAVGRHLLAVRNNLNYAPGFGGYASLPPVSGEAVFPAFTPRAGANQFDIRLSGSAKVSVVVTKCSAERIQDPDGTLFDAVLAPDAVRALRGG